MKTFVMRKPTYTNASVTSCTIGQSQHQSKKAKKMLPKCYLVTRFTYNGFSKEKFAYLFLLFKQKGYDNA